MMDERYSRSRIRARIGLCALWAHTASESLLLLHNTQAFLLHTYRIILGRCIILSPDLMLYQ